MKIRHARPDDAEGIRDIYNHAVTHTTAIWNDTTVNVANRTEWIADRQRAGHPVVVAAEYGTVVGFASFGAWRHHEGFRHTVEHSVYVRADQRGKGLGRSLMESLITHAREAGVHVMVGAIESGNDASIRLHEKLGFRSGGTLHQVGVKFGTWLDLTFMQLTLDDRPQGSPGSRPNPSPS